MIRGTIAALVLKSVDGVIKFANALQALGLWIAFGSHWRQERDRNRREKINQWHYRLNQ
jgi:hypothetical protein